MENPTPEGSKLGRFLIQHQYRNPSGVEPRINILIKRQYINRHIEMQSAK